MHANGPIWTGRRPVFGSALAGQTFENDYEAAARIGVSIHAFRRQRWMSGEISGAKKREQAVRDWIAAHPEMRVSHAAWLLGATATTVRRHRVALGLNSMCVTCGHLLTAPTEGERVNTAVHEITDNSTSPCAMGATVGAVHCEKESA